MSYFKIFISWISFPFRLPYYIFCLNFCLFGRPLCTLLHCLFHHSEVFVKFEFFWIKSFHLLRRLSTQEMFILLLEDFIISVKIFSIKDLFFSQSNDLSPIPVVLLGGERRIFEFFSIFYLFISYFVLPFSFFHLLNILIY